MILNGANGTSPQRPFADRLRDVRTAKGHSVHVFASSAGVSDSTYREWEAGIAAPSRPQLRRMVGNNHQLEAYLPRPPSEMEPSAPPTTTMGQALARAGVTSIAPPSAPPVERPIEPAAPVHDVKPSPPPAADARAFGDALLIERRREKMSQHELGHTLGVSGSSVSDWELGYVFPIRRHYDALIALLPRLAAVPVDHAQMHTWEKPGRATGTVVAAKPAPPPPTPPPPSTPAGDPLSAIDRVILAFDALGQSVDLQTTRAAGQVTARLVTADGEELAAGEGPSLTAAALAMLDGLLASLVQRQESTRRVVEQAGARLATYTRAVEAVRGAVSPKEQGR